MYISASKIAEVARPDFCPRCLWIKLKMNWELPFERPMPSIFSSIDRYVKNVVHTHYDQNGQLPKWFPYLGMVTRLENAPSWRDFYFSSPQLGVTLRGEPDDILQLDADKYYIIDYKTARYTLTQDELFPLFEAQLNAYAYIAEHGGFFSPISGLSLVYLEPDTDFRLNHELLERSVEQLMLGFTPKVKKVDIKPDSFIEGLLRRVLEINEMEEPPEPRPRCENCQLVRGLVELMSLSVIDLLTLEAELQRLPDFSNGWNPVEVQLALQKFRVLLSNLKQKMGL